MTELDDEIVPEVVALIAEIGVNATITETAATLVPSTGAMSGGGTAHSNVKATPPAEYDSHYIDGEFIRSGDVEVYVNGPDTLGFTPKEGWIVEIASKRLRIVRVVALSPGNSIAAFALQLRRG